MLFFFSLHFIFLFPNCRNWSPNYSVLVYLSTSVHIFNRFGFDYWDVANLQDAASLTGVWGLGVGGLTRAKPGGCTSTLYLETVTVR
jgi:hypothetical protein